VIGSKVYRHSARQVDDHTYSKPCVYKTIDRLADAYAAAMNLRTKSEVGSCPMQIAEMVGLDLDLPGSTGWAASVGEGWLRGWLSEHADYSQARGGRRKHTCRDAIEKRPALSRSSYAHGQGGINGQDVGWSPGGRTRLLSG
jgi:hypothetical protein